MALKNFCSLLAGGWKPKQDAGGHQLQDAIPAGKSKNQLEPNAFSEQELALIRAAIKKKYRSVSRSAKGYFKYPVGRIGAEALGYDAGILDTLPDEFLDSFCGVGNPFAIEPIDEGSAVLDVGCGTGLDLYVASRLVGEAGRVCGVDLSEEMARRARRSLQELQVKNSEIHLVSSERLPFSDGMFDVVISNGVVNLSPDKPGLFGEIHRVLKPGGRLQFADIILEADSPPPAADVDTWSQWIGGAIPGGDQIALMQRSGFTQVIQVGTTAVKTAVQTVGALFKARKPWLARRYLTNRPFFLALTRQDV
jgi:arsenite methyltransferase